MWYSLPLHNPVDGALYNVRTSYSKSLTFLAFYSLSQKSFISVDNSFVYPIHCISSFSPALGGIGYDVIGGNFRVWS